MFLALPRHRFLISIKRWLRLIEVTIDIMLQRLFNLNKEEAKAFGLHLFYVIFEGVVLGVFALNEFVFIKGVKGSDFQLGFLLMFGVFVLIFSTVINEFVKRFKNTKKLIRITAFVTHVPLLVIGVFPYIPDVYESTGVYHYLFLSIFFVYYLNKVIALPKINLMLKSVYRNDNFGRLYSWASSVNKFVMLGTTFGFGWLLDYDQYSFVWLYPIMGVVGIISFYMLSLIKFEDPEKKFKSTFKESVISSTKKMFVILKTNKPYLHFEAGFMLYGFAWMITAAAIPIFFSEVFEMNNKSYSFYKTAYNLIPILILPYFGKLIEKIDPRRFASITFAALALHIFFLATTQYWDTNVEIWGYTIYASLIVSYTFYGVFAATMALLWFIGSAYFCKKEEVGNYQAIHQSLTGLRALFFFFLGIALFHQLGFFATFMIGVVALILGIFLMGWSQRKIKLVKQQ